MEDDDMQDRTPAHAQQAIDDYETRKADLRQRLPYMAIEPEVQIPESPL